MGLCHETPRTCQRKAWIVIERKGSTLRQTRSVSCLILLRIPILTNHLLRYLELELSILDVNWLSAFLNASTVRDDLPPVFGPVIS